MVSSLSVYGLSEVTPDRTVTEDMPIDPAPERRDTYSHTKIRQELALRAAMSRSPVETIVLRPGPLYGRGEGGLPARLGLVLPGCLLRLGANAPVPLSHVDHCADAVQLAACSTSFPPGTYNVVDDEPPSVEEYLALYRRHVSPLRVLPFPLPVTLAAAHGNAWLHVRSRGQVPLVLTPYRVRNLWRGHRYENVRLKEAGWRQSTPTPDALLQAFRELKARMNSRIHRRPDARPDDCAELHRRVLAVPQMPKSR
jgi:nucleoside-diphosphate-sugar epimerase